MFNNFALCFLLIFFVHIDHSLRIETFELLFDIVFIQFLLFLSQGFFYDILDLFILCFSFIYLLLEIMKK